MSRRAAALAGTIAAAAVAVAGCSADDEPSAKAPATYTSVPAPAMPSATVAPSSGAPASENGSATGEQPNVKRGAETGEAGVDVLVTVAYQGGKVTPPADVVDVKVGNKVKIKVTSDQSQNIDVEGLPDKSADVSAKEPEDIDWTVTKPGDTKVTLRESGALLVTVHAS
ncbi:hypothetical protein G3I59_17405 [Amycolatopsis rubida]|uniref:Lipoprotein n=1 Tax=Amycolatopsis rubida TaxID=112413 RepID=A0A1I6AEL6_9PSEU|nr:MULTISPECIES: hypothetical protein [Amycolatopsis]MYW92332.1 hypothetical protein [Amycolatopsis rubida]NEC57320.1 hypothetical protein [Amycolatopsis rubida]OAP23804.1 hypothetical protein A4R44_05311 [Amycolatopsis sp. M39]SFQ67080.1 hypothetical protein SAMN05421854_118142 [Amycolatopsis rubida]